MHKNSYFCSVSADLTLVTWLSHKACPSASVRGILYLPLALFDFEGELIINRLVVLTLPLEGDAKSCFKDTDSYARPFVFPIGGDF